MRRFHLVASRFALVSALAALPCAPAQADMGVPMLAVVWPASWLLLFPVILLEAWMAVRVLGVRRGEGIRLATAANLFSTILGIPLMWTTHLIVGGLVGPHLGAKPYSGVGEIAATLLGSPWVFPDSPGQGWRGWLVIESAMILSVPFFLMSVAVEGWVVSKGIAVDLRPRVWRWAWQANALSYGLIELGLGVMLILALRG